MQVVQVVQVDISNQPFGGGVSTHLVTSAARRERCPECRRDVLAGLSEGLAVAVDIAHLDQAAEVAALVAGVRTFDLYRCGRRVELWHRDQWRIRSRKYPVMPEHPCFQAHLVVADPVERAVKRKRQLRPLNEAVNAQLQLPMRTDDSVPF